MKSTYGSIHVDTWLQVKNIITILAQIILKIIYEYLSEVRQLTARWPSWLWRQVKVTLALTLLMGVFPRGFKSHSRHFLSSSPWIYIFTPAARVLSFPFSVPSHKRPLHDLRAGHEVTATKASDILSRSVEPDPSSPISEWSFTSEGLSLPVIQSIHDGFRLSY